MPDVPHHQLKWKINTDNIGKVLRAAKPGIVKKIMALFKDDHRLKQCIQRAMNDALYNAAQPKFYVRTWALKDLSVMDVSRGDSSFGISVSGEKVARLNDQRRMNARKSDSTRPAPRTGQYVRKTAKFGGLAGIPWDLPAFRNIMAFILDTLKSHGYFKKMK